MELKGKYKKSVTEFYDCTMSIENGIVHKVLVLNAVPMEYFKINPEDNAEFKYYKLASKSELTPAGTNYKLQYANNDGEINTVFLNLNKWKLYNLKWQKKELPIQSKELKIEILKYGVISILIWLAGLFTAQMFRANQSPNKKEIIVKKESDSLNKNLVKNDTLRSEETIRSGKN